MRFTSCPTTLFGPPYSPLSIVGAHIYFFIPPQEWWSFFPTQIQRGQNGTTSVGTTRS